MTKNELEQRLKELTQECRASEDDQVRMAESVFIALKNALLTDDVQVMRGMAVAYSTDAIERFERILGVNTSEF